MKISAFVLAFILLFSGCSDESGFEPFSPPYLTPFSSFVPNDEVDFVYFLDDGSGDYIKSRYALSSDADKSLPKDAAFIFSGDDQIFTELALTSENICSDGEYYYYCGIVPGKGSHLFRTENHFDYKEAVAAVGGMGMVLGRISCSGGYIISPSNSPHDFCVTYYDIETGKSFTAERLCAVDELVDVQPCNGCYAYVEKCDGGMYLMGIDPSAPDKIIESCSVPVGNVLSAAFDGRTFVWRTSEGIYYCEKGGEIKTVFEGESTGFTFLSGRDIVYGDAERKVTFFYDIPSDFAGGHIFELYDFVYSDYDKSTAVLLPKSDSYPAGYVTLELLNIDYGSEERWSVPYSIKVDGEIYYCYMEKADIEPTEEQISGYISTVIYDPATMPSENDQANIGTAGMPYAYIDGNMYLYTANNSGYFYTKGWYKCEKAEDVE